MTLIVKELLNTLDPIHFYLQNFTVFLRAFTVVLSITPEGRIRSVFTDTQCHTDPSLQSPNLWKAGVQEDEVKHTHSTQKSGVCKGLQGHQAILAACKWDPTASNIPHTWHLTPTNWDRNGGTIRRCFSTSSMPYSSYCIRCLPRDPQSTGRGSMKVTKSRRKSWWGTLNSSCSEK